MVSIAVRSFCDRELTLMWQLVLKKTVTVGVTLWLTLTVAFVALRLLPGNAIDAQLSGTGLPESVVEARKATLGLDLPLWQQYINYLIGIPTGDWGNSLYTRANRSRSTLEPFA